MPRKLCFICRGLDGLCQVLGFTQIDLKIYLSKIIFFVKNWYVCMKLWLQKLLSGLKRHKPVSDSSESTIFQYYMKHSFMYLLVPRLSLRSVGLCIMCVWTIAGRKLTENYVEGYIRLLALLSITSHYFDRCIVAAFGIL